MHKGNYVPVGKDQVLHVELTREICRRFNSYYGEVFRTAGAADAGSKASRLDGGR
jgi:tryptophanyl-tRNA synthetase